MRWKVSKATSRRRFSSEGSRARISSAFSRTSMATIHGARTLLRPNNQLMRIRRLPLLRTSLYGRTSTKPNSAPCRPPPTSPTLLGIYARVSALALFSHDGCPGEVAGRLVRTVPDDAVSQHHRPACRSTSFSATPAASAWCAAAGRCFRRYASSPASAACWASSTSFRACRWSMPTRSPTPRRCSWSELAAPILGEVVGWRRWSAVAVGFVGVLVMLEPWNISVHWLSLVVLLATFCYSLSTVLTAPDQPLRPRCGDDLLVLPVRQRGVADRRHPGVEVAVPRRLVLAELAGPDRRGRPDPGHAGAAPRTGIDPGALRLQLHRAGGSLRLSVVQGGTVAGGLVRPAAGHRLGPLHPPPRAGPRPRARPGGRAMTLGRPSSQATGPLPHVLEGIRRGSLP